MRHKAQREVMDFCLEHAAHVSVARRAAVYRGMAEICGDPQEQRQLLRQAAALETAERHCRQFRLNFTQPET